MIDNALARIRAYVAHMGWSRNRLAAKAGVWESTIRDIGADTWNPTTNTLRKLEAVIPADFGRDLTREGQSQEDRAA